MMNVITHPNQEISAGDWVVVTDTAYSITPAGAVGQVISSSHAEYRIAFEPDTVSFLHVTTEYFRTSDILFYIVKEHVKKIKRPVARIAELEERCAQQQEIARIQELRSRANLNLVSRLSSRITYRNISPAGQQQNKINGDVISACIISGDISEHVNLVCDVINNTHKATLLEVLEKKTNVEDYIECCIDCSDYFESTESTYIESHGSVCGSCIDNYRYSGVMGEYIHDDDALHIYESARAYGRAEPDDYCTRSFGRNDDDLYSYNGSFVNHDTYYELSDDDDDDDDDENDINDGLRDYHSSRRDFVECVDKPTDVAFGVELEVYAHNRGSAVQAAKTLFSDWYYESDGSLDDDYGFEIISQPLGLSVWQTAAPRLLKALSSEGAVAYTQPNSNLSYGIHINVHRRNLTPLQEMRILMFIQAIENKEFLQALAQRKNLYGGDAKPFGDTVKSDMTVRKLGGRHSAYGAAHKTILKPKGFGKYSALFMHQDTNIAEFRMFQSTLHAPSFLKNIEFVQALIDWTSSKTASGVAYLYTDFVAWLAHPKSDVSYPNLMAFVRKPHFNGIGYDKPIKNNWNNLLLATTTKSLSVVTGEPDLRLAA